LRSETALLQIVGRAARNIHGTAIFYANRITKSMQSCIDATSSRRIEQLAYNRDNAVQMKSTTGSTMLSIFDLLKLQLEEEMPLEVVGGKMSSTRKYVGAELDAIRRDGTVPLAATVAEINTGHIPSSPGVYFWKDSNCKILYVGKAKRLRSRIKSYLLPGSGHCKRIQVMMNKANSIDFILTESDREALLLESNLIKHHQPPYNVLLKDDESYPYICASLGDSFPRLFVVPRRFEDDNQSARKYRYFGPYPHFKEINTILEGVEERYDLRAKSFIARHDSGDMTKEEYNELFEQVLVETFGSGGSLSGPNNLAAMRIEFEEAGVLFDPESNCSLDVVALEAIPNSETSAIVHIVKFRKGMVAGRFSYQVQLPSGMDAEEDRAAAILHVLERKHYPSGDSFPTRFFFNTLPSKQRISN
jgi:Ultra-violet resistance protein B/GIY-YIG catalytic domain